MKATKNRAKTIRRVAFYSFDCANYRIKTKDQGALIHRHDGKMVNVGFAYICTGFVCNHLGLDVATTEKIEVTLSNRYLRGGQKVKTNNTLYFDPEHQLYCSPYPSMSSDLHRLNKGLIANVWIKIKPVKS